MSRTRIWVPEGAPLPPAENIIVELPPFKMEGHVHIDVLDAKTGVVIDTRDFKNVITNFWMDAVDQRVSITSMNSGMNWYLLGTGSLIPSASDVTMSCYVGQSNDNGGIGDATGWTSFGPSQGGYWSFRRTRLFLENNANGILTEIAAAADQTTGTPASLCTHALILDVSGSSAPITKTSDQQLRISYEVRLYPPTENASGSFTLSGSTYNYVLGPMNISSSNAWGTGLGVTTRFGEGGTGTWRESVTASFVSGGNWTSNGNSVAVQNWTWGAYQTGSFDVGVAYQHGSFVRDFKFTAEPNTANFNIGGITFSPSGDGFQNDTWGMSWTGSIPKNNLQRLTFIMRYRWARLSDST